MDSFDDSFWNDHDDNDTIPTIKQLQKRKEQLLKSIRARLAGLPPRPQKRSRPETLAEMQRMAEQRGSSEQDKNGS